MTGGAVYSINILEYDGSVMVAPPIEFTQLSYSRKVNSVGQASVTYDFDVYGFDLFKLDRQMRIYRQAPGAAPRLELISFMRDFDYDAVTNTVTLSGPDQNDLLARRVIEAKAGTAGALKTGNADDIMKEFVNENCGTSAAADRDYNDLGLTWSEAADASAGPSVTKSGSYDDLLEVLKEIAEQSLAEGTPLYFDVVVEQGDFIFTTFTDRRGKDRRDKLIVSRDAGTLENTALQRYYAGTGNYVYAGGQGQGEARIFGSVEDTSRTVLSPINRREHFFDGGTYSTVAGLQSAAKRRLSQLRPRISFSGNLLSTTGASYGKDWYFGDEVRAWVKGEIYDVQISSIYVTFRGNGMETVRARLEYYD